MITKRPLLICLVGMDGTGKTTQAKRLTEALRARGIKSKYVWNTYQPVLLKPFIMLGQMLFLRKKNAFKDYSGYSKAKRGLFKNRLLAWSYEQSLLLDYWFQNLIHIRAPLLRGKTVVSDRYIHDAIVNLTIDLDYSEKKTLSKLNRLLSLVPRPDLVVFLDAPEEVSLQRKTDVPSIAHLKGRRGIYLDLAREVDAKVVDGSKSLEEVESLIHAELKRVLDPEQR